MGLFSWMFPTPEVRLERAINRGVVRPWHINQPHLTARLKRRRFEDVHFIGDFSGREFVGSTFERCDFRKAKLLSANFNGANLRQCNFKGSVMSSVTLHETLLADCDLRQACLQDAHLANTVFHNVDLRAADLRDMTGRNVTFRAITTDQGTCTNGSELHSARFEPAGEKPCIIAGDWRGVHMPRAAISAHVASANLSGANLQGTHFTACTLKNSNLKDANIQRSHFQRCHLHRVQLPADLHGVSASDCTQVGLDRATVRQISQHQTKKTEPDTTAELAAQKKARRSAKRDGRGSARKSLVQPST